MEPSKAGNINWISNVRIIALYAVIVLHCSSLLLIQYGKVPTQEWWIADYLNAITRFAVPVFVMITGALLLNREYEIGDFLRKRLTRVVVPFLFWSLVYVGYSWYNEEITFGSNGIANVRQVLHLLLHGASYHLWYVYMLIGLYFFIPVLGKFVRNASEKEIVYFLIVWLAVMLITQPYLVRYNPAVDMHYFAGFAGYLVLGHYLACKDLNIKNLRLYMVLLFLCSIIIIAVGSKLVIGYPQFPGTMLYEPVSPAVVALSASAFIIAKLTVVQMSPAVSRVRDFVGKYNYGIYLAHALVLYFLDDLAGISYKLCTPIVSIPLTALICFLITLPLVWAINKLPWIGKWISG